MLRTNGIGISDVALYSHEIKVASPDFPRKRMILKRAISEYAML